MTKIIIRVLKGICFLLAALWLGTVVDVQLNCSIIPSVGHQCHGQDTMIWLFPLVFSAIGIPAVLASIIIVVTGRRKPRREP